MRVEMQMQRDFPALPEQLEAGEDELVLEGEDSIRGASIECNRPELREPAGKGQSRSAGNDVTCAERTLPNQLWAFWGNRRPRLGRLGKTSEARARPLRWSLTNKAVKFSACGWQFGRLN